MPNFRYKALTQRGEVVSGSIAAATSAEVAQRIEYLGLVPIDTVPERDEGGSGRSEFSFGRKPKPEEITTFTRDLALLLKAGARIDDALDSLATEADFGRLRPVVTKVRANVLAGESLADALAKHSAVFPTMYVALVRVAEASGSLEQVLETMAEDRARSEQLRRKVSDAARYPAFILVTAGGVMMFFLLFVLPQFGSVLREFGAKLDPMVTAFLALSDFLRSNTQSVEITAVLVILGGWLIIRQEKLRAPVIRGFSSLPLISSIVMSYRTSVFCRNLGILLGNGVTLTVSMRMLVDLMATSDNRAAWTQAVEHVRQGGKLSDALAETHLFPPIAVRMLRLGEETGQLPMLSARISDFFEAKLQRSLERVVGIAGPAAIIVISFVVGGLIVSIMTSLLSINQIVE
jgi:general secretion pathway protein F